VLVAGGQTGRSTYSSSTSYLATAELYDEEAGTWSSTAAMHRPRSIHTVTMLLSGQVLMTGGFRVLPGTSNPLLGSESFANAEFYDPETGQWTEVGSMNAGGFMVSGRHDHVAVLLPDGRTLASGGTTKPGGSSSTRPNPTSEIYDPATSAWMPTGSPRSVRASGLRALLLPTGRVLVTGGTDDASAELYIP
jgi:hypothetical protein